MAFNLDKNEGAKSSTKFDLSKKGTPTAALRVQQKRSSKTWLFVIPVLLIAGLVWYLSSNQKPNHETGRTATDSTKANMAPANNPEVATLPVDTQAAIQKASTESSTAATSSAVTTPSFNNKVPATFSKGSDAISNLNEALIKDVIAFMKKNPAAVVMVNGYASSEGEPDFNQQISQSRADAFKRRLISKGIDASRVNAVGKGIDNPISPNDTEEGRVKNRRVEVVLQ